MWDRENNSEDELDLVFKDTGEKDTVVSLTKVHQYLPEPTFNPVSRTNVTTADDQQGPISDAQDNNPGKQRAKPKTDVANRKDAITLENSDEDYDQKLLKKFAICEHLPFSNKP